MNLVQMSIERMIREHPIVDFVPLASQGVQRPDSVNQVFKIAKRDSIKPTLYLELAPMESLEGSDLEVEVRKAVDDFLISNRDLTRVVHTRLSSRRT